MKNLITLEKQSKISKFCKQNNIIKYTINSDGSVDVDGDVDIINLKGEMPLHFGKITGRFNFEQSAIFSLEGFPHTIGGDFRCSYNYNLTSLLGAPTTVCGNYEINGNNIKSLVGMVDVVNGSFNCQGNALPNLNGAPSKVSGDFKCNGNALTTLEGGPKSVGGVYSFGGNNRITTLVGCASTIGGSIIYSRNSIISTYSGDTDIEYGGIYSGYDHHFPKIFMDNLEHIKIILKYQRHYYIWNEDLSLNEENLQELLDEINDGLE